MLNNDKETTTAINFDSDWRYTRVINSSSYNDEFMLFSYNDQDWTNIQLPHYDDKKLQKKFTSTCVSYWYRKRFDLKQKYDKYQHIYLHFEYISDDNKEDKESVVKIPAVTIWLNEKKIFLNTLPQPISLTNYLKNDSTNLLVIFSKHGYRLHLHARLLLPKRLSGQIDLNYFQENINKNEERNVLDYVASFDDSDGLIALFIDAVKKHAKKNSMDFNINTDQKSDVDQNQLQNIKNAEINKVKTVIHGPIPRLAIVMLIVGTRGDVQPFIALAKALLTCGHRVRLATHETFRKFVRENNIEFYPLGGDPADLMSFMVKNAGIVPSVSSIVAGDIAKSRRVMAEILTSTWKACTEDDDETGVSFVAQAIIANPPSYGHIHCAQKLQIPLHIVFTMPWSPTVQFPHPLCKVDYNRSPIDRINMLSYDLVEVLTWSGMRNIINEFRKDILGLSTLHTRQAVRLMIDEHVPHTYCWSPSLVPKPNDWPEHIDVSGFFFLDLATNYKPPEDLVQFLKSGDPPIYIGFGSITGHDSDRLLQTVLEALKTTEYRALLSGFDVDHDKLPDNVLKIGNCPHDWLFQHVSAVCHHGGAGTTAAGLRAARPTIIVPFFGDQFFWGSMISKSGAGPPPMPGKTITAKQLASAFEFVHDPKTQSTALKISTDFQHENGCEVAVRSFHEHLPLNKMRSDLEPSFAACFRLNDYDLQISRPVAQVLVAAGVIEIHDLSPHRTYPWSTLIPSDRYEAFSRGFKRAMSKIADSVQRLRRSRSTSNPERRSARITEKSIKYEIVNIERPFKDNLPLYGEIKEQNEEEHDENFKSDKKTKPTVHYNLSNCVVKSSNDYRRENAAFKSASFMSNSSRKDLSKSRTNNTNSRNISNQNHRTQIIYSQQISKKTPRPTSIKGKSSLQSKDKINKKSPEQKAADISGLPTDICKQILSSFNQMKQDRHNSNNNEKTIHRIRIPHSLHRQRSRSLTTN